MKTALVNTIKIITAFLIGTFNPTINAQTIIKNFNSSGTIVFGAGVTSVNVSMWGGGGGGSAGGASSQSGTTFTYYNGAGGGGSNWTGANVTVVPGQIYNYVVGLGGFGGGFDGNNNPLGGGNGKSSSFLTVISPGGYGGSAYPSNKGGARANNPTPNPGSTYAIAGQDAKEYYGGDGGASNSGAYGASGYDENGFSGYGYGRGALGYTTGVPGLLPGDGGGGGGYTIIPKIGLLSDKRAGGSGGNGRVEFRFSCNYQLTKPPLASAVCASGASTITLRSSSMSSGSYVVSYNTSNPTQTGLTASMTFDSATDSGTFTTIPLSASSVITITNLASGTTCSNSVSTNNVVTAIVENTTANDWNRTVDFMGAARSGATSFTIGNKAYLGTGKDATNYYNDFWVFDAVTNAWTQIADFEGAAREGASGLGIGNNGYVGTGSAGTTYYNDFWQYDPLRNDWITRTSLPAPARSFSTGFVIGAKGYLGTGWNGSTYYNDFWEYDPITNAWTSKAAFNGTARYQAISFSIGSKGYLGTGANGALSYQNFSEYDPTNNTWTTKATFPGIARRAAVGFSVSNKGYLGAGWNATNDYTDFYEYNPITNIWSAKAAVTARHNAVGFGLGNKGYIATGTNGSIYFNDFYEYSPSNSIILTGALATNSFCTGTQIDIPFKTGDCSSFHPTANNFIAQLSDSKGSFANPTDLGTITGSGSGMISVILPSSTPAGSNYRFRIIGTSPFTIGSDNGADFAVRISTINSVVASASKLSICEGESINLSVSNSSANDSDSTIIITGDFESAMDEWSFLDYSSYTHGGSWYATTYNSWINPDGHNVHSNNSSAYYLSSSSGHYSTDITNSALQSPVFSTIGYNKVSLSFFHTYQYGFYNNQDSIRVQVSEDYGSSWKTVFLNNSSNVGYEDGFSQQVVNLDQYANKVGLMIRFNYRALGGMGRWFIDNITVKGVSNSNTYKWSSTPSSYNSLVQNPTGAIPLETTTYKVTNNNNYGCNANVSEVQVTVRKKSSSITSISLCPSELPYIWNGLTFTLASTKTATLTNKVGCDSLATLQLTLRPVSSSNTNLTICPSDLPYRWNGLLFNNGGTQIAHLLNTFGCDSSATLNLTIKQATSSIKNLNICESELPYSWNGVVFRVSGSQSVHFTNSVGCDSIATLNIFLIPSSNVVASSSLNAICPGGTMSILASSRAGTSITVLNESFNATGNDWKTYNNSIGGQPAKAEWALSPHLYSQNWTYGNEFKSNDNSQFYLSSSIAQGYDVTTSTTLESPSFSTVGLASASLSFFHHFKHQVGINGNANDSIRVQISADGSTWTNIYFNKSSSVGFNPDNFLQQIISLNAYLNKPSLKLRFEYNGKPFNLQGWTGFNLWWAIDNVTVTGTISPATYTWSSTPNGFTSSSQNPLGISPSQTTKYKVVASSAFCTSSNDVTVTLKDRSVPSTTNLTICNSQLPYVWNGLTFNSAGSQTKHFTVAGSCDSSATLILAVNNVTTSNTDLTICPSELPFSWNGLTFIGAGTQTAHLTNKFGCDSAATLVLGIQYANAVSYTNMTLCESEMPFMWNGQSLVQSGRFKAVLKNKFGCDSIANLNLVVNPNPTNAMANISRTSVCNGENVNLLGSVDAISSNLTILKEDFNGNSDYWLTVNESTGGSVNASAWNKQPDGYLYLGSASMHSNDQSPFFISDSHAQGSGGTTNTTLQSPVFSTIGLSAASLKFYHTYYRNDASESIKVQISTDGSNWQNVYYRNTSYVGSYTAFALENVSLNTYLNQPYVSIRFVYNASNDYLWALDNVLITGTPSVYTYDWKSTPIGFSSTQKDPIGVIPTQNTKYTFTAKNETGCSSSSNVQVRVSGTLALTPSIINLTICQNELPYPWNGLTFTTAGSKTTTITSSLGCDSTITLNLTVRSPKNSITNIARCAESLPYIWNGLSVNSAGSQSVTLKDMYGCDSIATLNLYITTSPISVIASASVSSICVGMNTNLTATVVIPDGIIFTEDFNAGSNNWVTFNNSSGRGAMALSGWSLRPDGYNSQSSNDNTQFFNTISAVPETDFTNTVLQSPAFSTMGYPNINLSFYQYYRDFNTNDSIRVQASKDNGVTWTNVYLHKSGDVGRPYSFQQTSVSLNAFADQPSVMIRFNYHAVSAAYYWTIDNIRITGVQSEPSYSWSSLPNGFNASGRIQTGVHPVENSVYTVNVTSAYGCKASDDVSVSVSNALLPSNTQLTICQDAIPFSWNGLTFSNAGTKTAYLTGKSGCDSIATLTLLVNSLSASTTNKIICTSEVPYAWNGLTFNTTSTKTATLINKLGCDSLATLNLTVKNPSSSNTLLSVCPSALPYSWNGLVFNGSGSQQAMLKNTFGCDSVATLQLTVHSISESTTYLSVCGNEFPYSWNGLTFNEPGVKTANLVNLFGCDSLATLNLTKKVVCSINNLSICSNEVPYSWNGLIFTNSGSQTAYLNTVNGCDSSATLNLTVRTVPVPTGVSATASKTVISLGETISLFANSDTPQGVILSEGFNDPTNNWTVSNLTAGGASSGDPNFTLTPHNTFLINTSFISNDNSQSYVSIAYGSNQVDVALESPSFSTMGYSAVSMSFYHRYTAAYRESILVEASTNRTNWSTVYSHEAGAGSIGGGSFTLQTVSLDSYINEPTVYVRFRYTSPDIGWYWGLDNVSITGTAASNSYSWSSNNSYSSVSQNPTNLSPTATSTYKVVVTNTFGCSSKDEVKVAVITPCTSFSNTQITACPSAFPYTWNGLVFANAGSKTAIITRLTNCDSLATLNLAIANLSSDNTLTVCANEIPYTWNNYVFNGAGVYTATNLRSVFGCDSIAKLTLIVNPIPTSLHASTSNSSISQGTSVNLSSTSDILNRTILSEDFNSNTIAWTTSNTSSNGDVAAASWTLRPDNYSRTYGFHSPDNSQFYLSGSFEQGFGVGGTTETSLQSPVFSTQGYSSVSLKFYQVYQDYDNNDFMVVQASTNGGSSWTDVYINSTLYLGSTSSFQEKIVPLNGFINQPNVMIRFRYHANEGYFWAIDNVSITGGADNSYSWSSEPIGFTSTSKNPTGVKPMMTTKYKVTATNSYGCKAIDNVIVNLLCPDVKLLGNAVTILASDVSPSLLDGTDFGTLSPNTFITKTFTIQNKGTKSLLVSGITLSGINASSFNLEGISFPISIAINNSSTFIVRFNPSTVGAKSATVTINSDDCDETAYTFAIKGVECETPSVPLTIIGLNSVCKGNTVTYSIDQVANATSYQWTLPSGALGISTTNSISVNFGSTAISGNIIVKGINSCGEGLSTTLAVTVNSLPTLVASASKTSICLGDNVTLTGSGASTYAWDNNVMNGIAFAPSTMKTYIVTGTDIKGCSSTASIEVNVKIVPIVAATASKTSICFGDNVTLTGSGADTYTWNNNVTNALSFIPNDSKTYTLTGTNANGCSSTSTVDVNVNALPMVVATASKTSICLGENVTLMGSGSDTYVWDSNVTDGVEFTPSTLKTYTVIGTDDSNGCSSTSTISVNVNTLPSITATVSKTAICLGENVTLTGSGASTYVWDNNVTDGVAFAPITLKTYTVKGTNANGCSSTASFDVNVNALPIVVATTSKSTICFGDNVTLTGSGASTYVWDNNVKDGVAFTPGTLKTYTVTGTYANGCSSTASVDVNVNALPIVVASASKPAICLGENVTLKGSGALTYTWDNNVTDGIAFAPSTLKTYTLTGTDAKGCLSTASVDVNVNPLPIVLATASKTAICLGENVTLTGSGASTYVWDNNVKDGVAFAPSTMNTYTVTGTDVNGCSKTASVNLIVNINPLPTIIAKTSKSSICLGENVTLTGSGGSTYSWDNNVTDGVSFAPSKMKTYTLTGTDVNGCSSTASVDVIVNALPIVVANTSTTAICLGQNVTLTGSGATNYTWNKNVINNVAFAPSTLTIYTVTGTDINGCSSIATVSVNVNALPTVVASASKSAICLGENVTLTGSGASTYVWDNNVTDGLAFTPNTMKTYILTGTDANGCVATSIVSVNVNSLPTVVASVSKPAICLGDNVILTGSGASTYTWDNNVTDGVSFAPSTLKTYTVTGTNLNGCSSTASVDVSVNSLPKVLATVSKLAICLGDNVTLTGSGASTYAWDNNVTNGVAFAPSTLTTYIVTGTDANGCSSTATVEVKVDNCSGIEEKLISNFKLYPNPTVDKLILDATDVITYIGFSYKIIDMQGKEVYNAELRSAKTEISLKNVCSRGIYILHLMDDHGVSVKQSKMVLEY